MWPSILFRYWRQNSPEIIDGISSDHEHVSLIQGEQREAIFNTLHATLPFIYLNWTCALIRFPSLYLSRFISLSLTSSVELAHMWQIDSLRRSARFSSARKLWDNFSVGFSEDWASPGRKCGSVMKKGPQDSDISKEWQTHLQSYQKRENLYVCLLLSQEFVFLLFFLSSEYVTYYQMSNRAFIYQCLWWKATIISHMY